MKKISKIGLATVICIGFAAAPHNTMATPCSCWDSGTSVYMGAKCHAAWDDMDDYLKKCLNDPQCKKAISLTLGINYVILGIAAMEQCHDLCYLAQMLGASRYQGSEWWYADPTAHESCLKQNPNVLRNWMPHDIRKGSRENPKKLRK